MIRIQKQQYLNDKKEGGGHMLRACSLNKIQDLPACDTRKVIRENRRNLMANEMLNKSHV